MITSGVSPNMISYNVMIVGLSKIGDLKEATRLWHAMVSDGYRPDCVTYTCIIHAHCGEENLKQARKENLNQAKKVFFEMVSWNGSPSVVTYTVLIHAHAEREFEWADSFFLRMI